MWPTQIGGSTVRTEVECTGARNNDDIKDYQFDDAAG
jgi:hypothetical protein